MDPPLDISTNLPDREDPSRDDAPRISDSNDEFMNLPFHGNCPKCRHFYTAQWFRFSRDSTKHKRFECEACHHQIFGIGRSSTQTTLASVDSIPASQRNSGTPRLTNPCICVNTSIISSESHDSLSRNLEGVNSHGYLTPIQEIITPGGRSRSVSLQRPNPPSPGEEIGRTNDANQALDDLNGGSSRVRQADQSSSKIKRLLGRFRKKNKSMSAALQHHLREKGKSGGLRLFGYQFSYTRIITQPLPSPRLLTQDVPTSRSSNPGVEPTVNSAISELIPASGSELHGRQDRAQQGARPEADVDITSPPNDPVSPRGSITVDAAAEAKQNRIKALRREKTLKSEVARWPECRCHPGCHCLGDNAIPDDSSENSRILPQYFETPDNSFPHSSYPYLLHGIGNHFLDIRRTLSTELSGSATNSRIHLNPLSAAPTLNHSNDSAPSLKSVRRTPVLTGQPRIGASRPGHHDVANSITSAPVGSDNVNVEASTSENATGLSRPSDPDLESERRPQEDESSSSTLSVDNEQGPSSIEDGTLAT